MSGYKEYRPPWEKTADATNGVTASVSVPAPTRGGPTVIQEEYKPPWETTQQDSAPASAPPTAARPSAPPVAETELPPPSYQQVCYTKILFNVLSIVAYQATHDL